MSYRSLLVLLDQGPRSADHVQAAIGLAKAFDCHLTGLAPVGVIDLPAAFGMAAAATVSDAAWTALLQQAERAREAFLAACREAGTRSYEGLSAAGDKGEALVVAARLTDLAIVGQPDPDLEGYRPALALLERLVLEGAHPVLMLPYAGKLDAFGTRVLIAWDGSREAARAASDALPLLRRARKVTAATWVEAGADDVDSYRRGLGDLQAWLARHGVDAETQLETTAIGIADAILSHAADLGADLIVMGAYSHARWTERLVGGATRGLLQTMTVPVLMSH